MLKRHQFLKECIKSLQQYHGKSLLSTNPQTILRTKLNRLQIFSLTYLNPTTSFSTSSKNLTTELSAVAIASDPLVGSVSPSLSPIHQIASTTSNSLYFSSRKSFTSNKNKVTKKDSIDSLGTWDTTTDLPLEVKQSIASGKPIPSISANSIGVSNIIGRRSYNEDQYGYQKLDQNLLYFAVYDGHGGAECAKFCANIFPKQLSYWLNHQETDITTAIHNSFLEVNNSFARWFKLRQKEDESFNIPSSGSTATICLLHNSVNLYIGQCGDSRAVICRSGEAQKLTQEHIPSLITEKERIEKSGGRCSQNRVNGRLSMTRSIGDMDLKPYGVIAEPDVRSLRIDHSRDAFLVLTTDGINNVMTDKEIVETVMQTEEPQFAAALLTETAFQYSSEDNITAMVIPLGCWGKYSAAATIFHSFGKSMGSSSRFG